MKNKKPKNIEIVDIKIKEKMENLNESRISYLKGYLYALRELKEEINNLIKTAKIFLKNTKLDLNKERKNETNKTR